MPQWIEIQEGTYTCPSKVCQRTCNIFREVLGESAEVRCREMLTTTPSTGGNIMHLGYFSAKGTGQIHCIEGPMDGFMYCQILDENLPPSATTLKMGRGWVFQHDNDMLPRQQRSGLSRSPLRSWSGLASVQTYYVHNPTDNLWRELRIAKRQPRNLKDLESTVSVKRKGPKSLLRFIQTW